MCVTKRLCASDKFVERHLSPLGIVAQDDWLYVLIYTENIMVDELVFGKHITTEACRIPDA